MPPTPVVLGIDPSLNCTGWAVFVNGKLKRTGNLPLTKLKNRQLKHQAILAEVLRLIEKYKPETIGIEEERVFRSTSATVIAEVIGIMKGVIYMENTKREVPLRIIDVNVMSGRKMFGVSTRDPDEIVGIVRKAFPDVEIIDDNAADAVVVAHYASLVQAEKTP